MSNARGDVDMSYILRKITRERREKRKAVYMYYVLVILTTLQEVIC